MASITFYRESQLIFPSVAFHTCSALNHNVAKTNLRERIYCIVNSFQNKVLKIDYAPLPHTLVDFIKVAIADLSLCLQTTLLSAETSPELVRERVGGM